MQYQGIQFGQVCLVFLPEVYITVPDVYIIEVYIENANFCTEYLVN